MHGCVDFKDVSYKGVAWFIVLIFIVDFWKMLILIYILGLKVDPAYIYILIEKLFRLSLHYIESLFLYLFRLIAS